MEASRPKRDPVVKKTFLVSFVVSLYRKEIAKELGRRFLFSPADRVRFLRDEQLGEPLVFKLLVDGASGQVLVFPPGEAQPSPVLSYSKEISRARRRASEFRIGLGHGAICGSLVCTETIGVQKRTIVENVFDFPYQVIDYFLSKVAMEDRLRPLTAPPVVLDAVLREHGFEHVPLKASSERIDAFGAQWIPVGEEVSSHDIWFGFGAKFAKIALNYTVFSSDTPPPFIAEMTSIHHAVTFDSEGFKKDVESRVAFSGTAKKIDLLRIDTPYAPPV